MEKLERLFSLGGTPCNTTLKYWGINFLRKELCRQRKSVLLWTLSSFTFVYIQHIYLCSKVPLSVQIYPKRGGDFYMMHHQS